MQHVQNKEEDLKVLKATAAGEVLVNLARCWVSSCWLTDLRVKLRVLYTLIRLGVTINFKFYIIRFKNQNELRLNHILFIFKLKFIYSPTIL
jgi:hypothetical protein